jgi:hypothetical protein
MILKSNLSQTQAQTSKSFIFPPSYCYYSMMKDPILPLDLRI